MATMSRRWNYFTPHYNDEGSIDVLDGKPPYIDLFDPLKQPLFQHLRSMHTEFSTTTADWEDASSTSSSNKGATIWFNEDAIDKSSRHEIGQSTVTHESEDDRFSFFNAVCTRLNSLQETKNSSETEEHAESPRKEKSSTPYGTDGFAPPPRSTQTNTLKVSNLPKRFESLYKKKRQQVATSDSSGFGSNASDFWSFERYGKSNQGTLERPNRLFTGTNNGFSTLQPKRRGSEAPKMTVELRYENDVPMVAKISANHAQSVTLRYFRHLFGLHYTDNCRFFFKSTCEDGSAQYQWTLLFHDDDILPVFQNRITAICRMCPPPEDHDLI